MEPLEQSYIVLMDPKHLRFRDPYSSLLRKEGKKMSLNFVQFIDCLETAILDYHWLLRIAQHV